jgi:hypothetical protein
VIARILKKIMRRADGTGVTVTGPNSLLQLEQALRPAFFMANYLPVLLVSLSTNALNAIPDDSSLITVPRAQVDYLSHDWQEEDVWRSWRNMTRQKNAIANGVRLENASWRTWWKQRNKLRTVSPETLNWYVIGFNH